MQLSRENMTKFFKFVEIQSKEAELHLRATFVKEQKLSCFRTDNNLLGTDTFS